MVRYYFWDKQYYENERYSELCRVIEESSDEISQNSPQVTCQVAVLLLYSNYPFLK